MNVVLISPPAIDNEKITREGRCSQDSSRWGASYPPLSLALCAGAIRDSSVNCNLYGYDFAADLKMKKDRAIEKIASKSPDVIIISFGSVRLRQDIDFSTEVKCRFPKAQVIIFGVQLSQTHCANLILNKMADIIATHELDTKISQICKNIYNDREQTDVPGIVYYSDKLSKIVVNQNQFQNNIEHFPYWGLFSLDKYTLPIINKKYLMVLPQRGCPWRCSFCISPIYHGRDIRSRSVGSVIAEIKTSIENFEIEHYLFWSDTFTMDKDYVMELCAAIKPLGIHWMCNTRAGTVTSEMAQAMKDSGCWLVTMGVENYNQQILTELKKDITPKQILSSIKTLRSCSIEVIGHTILGSYSETWATLMYNMFKLYFSKLSAIQSYHLTPYLGTEVRSNYSIEENFNLNQSIPSVASKKLSIRQLNIAIYVQKYILSLRINCLLFYIKCLRMRFNSEK